MLRGGTDSTGVDLASPLRYRTDSLSNPTSCAPYSGPIWRPIEPFKGIDKIINVVLIFHRHQSRNDIICYQYFLRSRFLCVLVCVKNLLIFCRKLGLAMSNYVYHQPDMSGGRQCTENSVKSCDSMFPRTLALNTKV